MAAAIGASIYGASEVPAPLGPSASLGRIDQFGGARDPAEMPNLAMGGVTIAQEGFDDRGAA